MTSKTEKATVPAELPPEAPAELHARRDGLVAGLEAEAKTATGTLQQVLRVMAQVVNNCRPGADMDPSLDTALREAFQRNEKTMGTNPWPPVLEESVQWMQDYLAARGFPLAGNTAVTAAAPAPVQGGEARDVFEKVSNKPSLTGEQPITTTTTASTEGSLKNWQLNPGLGKVRG